MLVFIRCSIALTLCGLSALTPAHATSVSFCVGDCNGDGSVTVDELIRGINIALGTLSVDECAVFDPSDDGLVTVDEIVTAVSNGLIGCPAFPTRTATTTSATPTPPGPATPTPTDRPAERVRVLITTEASFGDPDTIVTSLGTPIIAPAGFVAVIAELTDESESKEALLRFSEDGDGSVLLVQGQPIPNSAATVGSIGRLNAKSSGVFVFVDTATGASLLQIRDGVITPVIGLGTSGARAELESRMFVVPVTGRSVVADVFAPGGTRKIVSIPLDDTTAAPVSILTLGDSLSYRNSNGDQVSTLVLGFEEVFAEGGGGTARLELEGPREALLDFAFDDTSLLDRHIALVQGNPAPGIDATFDEFPNGAAIGGMTGNRLRGFDAALLQTGTSFEGSAVFITDTEYDPLFTLQVGAAVPDMPGATIDAPDFPAMGREAAAMTFTLVDSSDGRLAALGFVDYQTQTFDTVVVAGDPAPGGGVFESIPSSFAISDSEELVFRGGVGGNDSAYYAAATSIMNAPLRRLVGTGDTVALPQGGEATITSLGTIFATSGLGGEPTAVGTTHFTVSASLDGERGAILLVAID